MEINIDAQTELLDNLINKDILASVNIDKYDISSFVSINYVRGNHKFQTTFYGGLDGSVITSEYHERNGRMSVNSSVVLRDKCRTPEDVVAHFKLIDDIIKRR